MIELGNYNTLEILRVTSVGLFLGDGEGTSLLLPNKYVPQDFNIGDSMEIFCYLDHEERPVATTLKPKVIRNGFGFLQVAAINDLGAFLDWGLEKQLLVPFREQRVKMQTGQGYVVYCYLDEKSQRLVATSRLDKFLDNTELEVAANDAVDLLVSRKTDLGWEVIINQKHKGLVFGNEVFKEIAIGDQLTGYIKQIRPDNKIDVSLQPLGVQALEPIAAMILDELQAAGGYMDMHDKSDPEAIKHRFQISKKSFKKGIGTLYKEGKITIKEDGIYLNT